jgi:hypothetical protein
MLHALLALSAFASLPDEEVLFNGTGPYKRPIVTQSVKARQFFDQGLSFLYAFNHGACADTQITSSCLCIPGK